MRRTTTRSGALIVAVALAVAACTSSPEAARGQGGGATSERAESALVTIPPVTNPPVANPPVTNDARPVTTEAANAADGQGVALIDVDGRLGFLQGGEVRNDWFKFTAFPSPDRSTAVLTLGPEIGGIGPERPVIWVDLPSAERRGEQVMRTASELTATSLDGTFAGFTSRAEEPLEGAIAGVRQTTEIEIISRDAGTVFEQTLDGNFVPEAFSRRLGPTGVPALVFLLEYFPADAPRFYRVRVLSTETGEVSLPLNLRNKSEQVDERMAGFSRSQVVAEEHGLLFTLYRGTLDGTPDGEPYAFVHTLDLADGVWCLEVDARLELDRLAGSLAVGGDHLYVASSNGFVGAYPIPALDDPDLSPSMEWVVDMGVATDGAPVVTADRKALYIVDPTRPGFLNLVSFMGRLLSPPVALDGEPQAMVFDDGVIHAVGSGWATFDLRERPDWLGEIAHVIVD